MSGSLETTEEFRNLLQQLGVKPDYFLEWMQNKIQEDKAFLELHGRHRYRNADIAHQSAMTDCADLLLQKLIYYDISR